ncbi:MAG: type II toxin-antitoxin system RelE/ParE family toxin [Proteobacteria bacterium]|nr:type II toxin-antitoxin system RelE/ParE family toxin [Pseudomonadota bacterium]
MYGFEKGAKENITDKEVRNLKGFAELYLGFNNRNIQIALENSELIEVENE